MHKVPTKKFHQTSLSQALKFSKAAWSSHLKFVHNHIYSENQRIINDAVIEKIISTFIHELKHRKWKKIDSFNFKLPYCPLITSQGYKIFGSHFKKLLKQVKFRKLEIDFRGCVRMTGSELVNISNKIKKSLGNLTNFNLKYTECKNLSDKNIAAISSNLSKRAPRLQKLKFDMSSCSDIGALGLKAIGKNLAHCRNNLQELCLNFLSCLRMNDDGIKLLILPISRYLRKLQRLDLGFLNCHNIKDQGLDFLSHYINQYLVNLKSLFLSFSGNFSISEEGLKLLLTNLNKNPQSLTRLALEFCSCNFKISNLKSDSFQNFQNLQQLSLVFRCCSKLTDKCLKEFGCYLSQAFKGLRNLSLQFYQCDALRDIGFQTLISYISHTSDYLEKLNLEFISAGISFKTVEFLGIDFSSNLKNIKELTFRYSGEFGTHDAEALENLKHTLNFIPHLNIYKL